MDDLSDTLAIVMKEAVATHPMKTARQHIWKEQPEEVFTRQRAGALLTDLAIAVTEGDLTIAMAQDLGLADTGNNFVPC